MSEAGKSNDELTPRQIEFLRYYNDPKSDTFGNALQSALRAGYSQEYAENITHLAPEWLSESIGRRKRLLEKAEQALEETLDMPIDILKLDDDVEIVRTDPALIRIKQDTAKFIAKTQGKDQGYSERQEVSGPNGTPLEKGLSKEDRENLDALKDILNNGQRTTTESAEPAGEDVSGSRKEACRNNRLLFTAWYFPKYIKYQFAPFHFEMFDDLEDLFALRIRELGWFIFRESAKTSIAKIAGLTHTICYGLRRYLNVDSFDKANAEAMLFDVSSALMQNKKLIKDFGQLFSKKREQDEMAMKRISKFLTSNGIMVEAHSTQESVRGRIFQDQRPDFLL
ncbi:MAG: hypothetical protein WDN67_00685 [Candidatus Moraniibacteriota bacterium]